MSFLIYLSIFTFGLLIGNFTTTVFYRLPRGIVVYGFNKKHTKPPHCSTCGHELKPVEYLPLISIFSTCLKCNYCGQSVPYSYVIMEFLSAFLAVACFYAYSDNLDLFIIIFLLCETLLLTTAILITYRQIFPLLTFSIILEGVIYRTLVDQTISNWWINIALASILSLLLLKGEEFLNPKKRLFVHFILALSPWI